MHQVIPAILAKDQDEFRSKLALLDGLAPVFQIDIMDGKFVKNETWFDPEVLRTVNAKSRFELHLMVEKPGEILERCVGINSIVRVIWHIEAKIDHMSLIKFCHSKAWQVGLAINPSTPVEELERYMHSVEEIQVMGNKPGFSGKKLEPAMIERALSLHAAWPSMILGIDIGVNVETIPELAKVGVTRFAAASAIYGETDPKAAYLALTIAGEEKEKPSEDDEDEKPKRKKRAKKD